MGFERYSYRSAILNRICRIKDDTLTFAKPVLHLGEIAVVVIDANPRQLRPILLHRERHPVLAATEQCSARDSQHIFIGPRRNASFDAVSIPQDALRQIDKVHSSL